MGKENRILDVAVQASKLKTLKSQLIAPSIGTRLVSRERIVEKINALSPKKLVLFCAPAGFGKTTAMRQYFSCLEDDGVSTGWLTLSALDEYFHRFIVDLAAVVNQVLNVPQPLVESESSSLDDLIGQLMDQITNYDQPFAIFLDEYEAASNDSTDDFLRLILGRLPPHGTLVIASRKTPNLQLARLRSKGQLVDVNQSDLCFTEAEVHTFFLDECNLSLTQTDVSRLYEQTEGWPAALWLTATALIGNKDPQSFISTFSGSSAIITEYLADEVISQQRDEIHMFLLKTSILRDLNKSLCDAVCGRKDSGEILKELESSNVCVSTVDSDHNLYRYHGLFAASLRHQLENLYPSKIPDLHRLAARWFDNAGRPVAAIDHAISSGDHEFALSLLDKYSDDLLYQGRFRLLARWLGTIPKEVLRNRLKLYLTHLWALAHTRRAAEALKEMEYIESSEFMEGLSEGLKLEIRILHLFILMALDRYVDFINFLNETPLNKVAGNDYSSYILTSMIALVRIAESRVSEAAELLEKSRVNLVVDGHDNFLVSAMNIEAQVSMTQGNFRQAIEHLRVALSQAAASYSTRSITKSMASIYLAESLYEVYELEEAERLLTLYHPVICDYAMPDLVIVSHRLKARISYARGDIEQSYRSLSELEYIGTKLNLPRVVAAAHLEWARIAMLKNNMEIAKKHYELAKKSTAWSNLDGMILPANDVETVELCKFRLLIRGKSDSSTVKELGKEVKSAMANCRYRRAFKLNILLAKVLYSDEQPRQAMRIMQRLLQTASEENLISAFLDEGVPVINLLREFRISKTSTSEAKKDQDMLSFVDKVLGAAGCNVAATPDDSVTGVNIKLSRREKQVLDLLALGFSNKKIAESIFVTETTVRAHLRKINVKLDAKNRTNAVSIARRLGLVD